MRRERPIRIPIALAVTGVLLLLTAAAIAGIPEPGVILYGQVLDEAGQLVTTGELTWTYAPAGGGDSVVISTPLKRLDGPGGPYSYKVLVPFEFPISGYPSQSHAVTVSATPAAFTRNGHVVGSSIQATHTVTLSREDRGNAIRVDVCLDCGASTKMIHSADVNEDFKFTLGEFLRVIEFYNATLTHDYHVNPAGEDGFGVGFGPRDGDPHSSDYYSGADWRLSLNEIVRIIDLFASTSDHSYSPDPMSEDGFKKGGETAGSASSAKSLAPAIALSMKSAASGVTMTREVSASGAVPGGMRFELTLNIGAGAGDPLSALAVRESLPPGWSYAGVVGGVSPLIDPSFTESGVLEFAWFPVPAGAFSFSYSVIAPGTTTQAEAHTQLRGTAFYRTVSGDSELQATVIGIGADAVELPSTEDFLVAPLAGLAAAISTGAVPTYSIATGSLNILDGLNIDGGVNVPGTGSTALAHEQPEPAESLAEPVPLHVVWPLAVLLACLGAASVLGRAKGGNE